MKPQEADSGKQKSLMSAAVTSLEGVCVAAATLVVAYYGVRAGVIPPLPFTAFVLLFPLSALIGTMWMKWRSPSTPIVTLAAYFLCVLVIVYFATTSVLPLDF